MAVTLPEFLLARIAEDEAVGREAYDNAQGVVFDGDMLGPDEPWRLLLLKRGTPFVTADPRRVLAECAAKRQIVEAMAVDGWRFAHHAAMQALTLPYADHPDYDEAWCPSWQTCLR